MSLYQLAKPFLFQLDAEFTHDLTLKSLKWAEKTGVLGLYHQAPTCEPRQIMGLNFPNAVGLAAGLDKNGTVIDGMAKLGFGFIEVGTATPRPQPGNPKPRLFRVPQAEGIINRFGFNNLGVDNLVENVKAAKYRGILGINIGKNADFRAVFLERRLYLCGRIEMKKAGHQHIYGCLAGPIRTK